MGLFSPRSEIVEADGWLWLAPRRRSVKRRHSIASFLIATLLWGGLLVYQLLPRVARELAIVLFIVLSIWLIGLTARTGQTRVAMSPIGVALHTGLEATQIGWSALRMVAGQPVRGRVRVLLSTGDQVHMAPATFDAVPAREWLDRCAAEARRRNLDPVPVEGALGWRSADLA
jgi:hypothetical protein